MKAAADDGDDEEEGRDEKTRGFQGSLSSSSTSKSRWPRESEAISQERRKSIKMYFTSNRCRDLGSLFSQAPDDDQFTSGALLLLLHFLFPSPAPSTAATGAAADSDHGKNVLAPSSPLLGSSTTQKPPWAPTFRTHRRGSCVRVCLQTVKKLSNYCSTAPALVASLFLHTLSSSSLNASCVT